MIINKLLFDTTPHPFCSVPTQKECCIPLPFKNSEKFPHRAKITFI